MKKTFKKITAILLLLAFAFSLWGCNGIKGKEDSSIISYTEITNSSYINSLIEYNDTLIGESTKIRNLVCDLLPGHHSVATYDITLNRLVIEYGPTTELDENGNKPEGEEYDLTEEEFAELWTLEIIQDVIMHNSAVLFTLIDNLNSVQFLIEGYNVPTFTISRENIESFFGYPLNDIYSDTDWNTKITAVCLDPVRIDEFYDQFPLKTELHVKTKEEIDAENAALLEQDEEETAEERVKRQMQEQYDKLPDEVQ